MYSKYYDSRCSNVILLQLIFSTSLNLFELVKGYSILYDITIVYNSMVYRPEFSTILQNRTLLTSPVRHCKYYGSINKLEYGGFLLIYMQRISII